VGLEAQVVLFLQIKDQAAQILFFLQLPLLVEVVELELDHLMVGLMEAPAAEVLFLMGL
jgi:hypothetical protein